MNEWKRIISDRKRLMAILCIPLLCLALFFYQKCDGDFGTLLTDAEEYRELLKTYTGSTPAQIVEAYSENWSLTDEEQRLLTQAEHLQDYKEYFEKSFLFSGVFMLLPAAAYYFGADGLAFLTPASFLADCSPIFYGTNTIPGFAIWMLVSVLMLLMAKRNWCKTA